MPDNPPLPLPDAHRKELQRLVEQAGLAAMVRAMRVSRESMARALAGLKLRSVTRGRIAGGLLRLANQAPLTRRPEYNTGPVKKFLAERCEVMAGAEVDARQLYASWAEWHSQKSNHVWSPAVFGRTLKSACPGVSIGRPRNGTSRIRVYLGIGLNP